MNTKKCRVKFFPFLAVLFLLLFSIRPMTASAVEIEVAPGYALELVAFGVVPLPTSIVFGKHGQLYVSSLATGQISAVDVEIGTSSILVPPSVLDSPMGLAVHPKTGMIYVTSRYIIPGGDPSSVADVKSRISTIDPVTGIVSTFVEGLPSMFFGELTAPITGSQGIDFDKYGNLYVAQGVNDVAHAAGDPFPSAILKVDSEGRVSVFASGLRAPYDVVVARKESDKKHGDKRHATILYAGDNGEGNECDGCPEDQPSRQYFDELNRVLEGKHYGWPGGAPEYPAESHRGPLWNFEINPANEFFPEPAWPVPTGIDIKKGKFGKGVRDPLFLALFNCPSMFVPDLGTIEMFNGIDYGERTTLAKYIDGPIDVRVGPDKKLYFAEFQTGNIYRIAPQKY